MSSSVGELNARVVRQLVLLAGFLELPGVDVRTYGWTRVPSTDVPQVLRSWRKKRPSAARRMRQCSRETRGPVATCTSTQWALPPRPIETTSLRITKTCGPCSST